MTGPSTPSMSAWRFVVAFGTVSLLSDFVYEGARSITGPLLASLGASALLVGVVTGVGEAAALLLRLVSGPLADRTKNFWAWTIGGYTLTMISVPLLGFSGALSVACVLVIAERVGKAIRSPAKDTLLSYATAATGRGRGFAVHEALDQTGALVGPLVVAGMLFLTRTHYGPSLAVLAVPAVATLVLLVRLRTRVPQPLEYELLLPAGSTKQKKRATIGSPRKMPTLFWVYAGFTALTMLGFATFGVISFHIVTHGVLPVVLIPVLYATAMLTDAAAALATGWAYDRFGPRVLLALPVVAAAIPALAFTGSLPAVVAGVLLWGAALGVQQSTLRARVADLVAPEHRSTAYGLFAAVLGIATAGGGILAGALLGISVPLLVAVTVIIQAMAVIFLLTLTRTRSVPTSATSHTQ